MFGDDDAGAGDNARVHLLGLRCVNCARGEESEDGSARDADGGARGARSADIDGGFKFAGIDEVNDVITGDVPVAGENDDWERVAWRELERRREVIQGRR